MRQLTIKRRKAFAGSLAAMSVYIEDAQSVEFCIGGIPCRKLGELKNGASQTFTVDEDTATVFVAPGKTLKERYVERTQLPEGDADIALEGQCYVNLLGGNAFCFDVNNHGKAKSVRTRNTVLGILLMCLVAAVSGFLSYTVTTAILSPSSTAKDFTTHGMTITLTEDFREVPIETHTAAFNSKHVTVIVLKEPFLLAEGIEELTLEDYAALVIENSALSCEPQILDERLRFEYDYTDPTSGAQFHYVAYAYKTDDAFWTINFATLAEHAAEHVEEIESYASSVTFD